MPLDSRQTVEGSRTAVRASDLAVDAWAAPDETDISFPQRTFSKDALSATWISATAIAAFAPLARAASPYAARGAEAGSKVLGALRPWIAPPSQWRLLTGTLSRRIFFANFIGLLILLSGFGVLTYQHTWLIDAKAESLKTQARMIAAAISSNAKVETQTMVIDPDHVSDIDRNYIDWRDESLKSAALEIRPERIAPILRKLIEHDNVRVRVYDRGNTKLLDSDGHIGATGAKGDPQGENSEKLRNMWTRFTAWVMHSPLQVYREIGSGKVTDYPEAARALEGEVTSAMLLNDHGEQIISVFAPVERLGKVQAFVWVTTRPGELEQILSRERRPFVAFSIVALLATVAASIMLNRTIGGPMKQLAVAAEHVSRNINARHEIPELLGRRDEVGEMARAYRKMTAALYRRIEASERFAQDVAHELKNPVAAARSTAETLTYAKTDQKRDELVAQISGELVRLNRLISDVSAASRLDAELALQETEPVNVLTIATNITTVFRDIQRSRDDSPCNVVLKINPEDASPDVFVIDGHEIRLGQVLTNLVDNALSFSPVGGSVTVTLLAEASEVVLRVDDQGPGIPADKLDDIFERFYSDRPQSDRDNAKNSGLGLFITREIVEAHGGSISAQNLVTSETGEAPVHDRPGLSSRRVQGIAGARFEVRLPRQRHRAAGTKHPFRMGRA